MNDDATAPAAPGATTLARLPSHRALRRGSAVAVAIGAIVALGLGVATVDARTLAAASGAPRAIATSLAIVLAAWLAEAVVFGALTGRLAPRDLRRMARIYLAGSFPSAVTPFASGSIPTWTWLLTREGLAPGEAAAVVGLHGVVTSAFFGIAALVAAIVLPGVLGPRWTGAVLGLVAVLLLSVALLAFVALMPGAAAAAVRRIARVGAGKREERLGERISAEVSASAATLRHAVRRRPLGLLLALAATCVSRALLFSVPFVLLRGFGLRVPWLPVVLGMLAVQVVGSATPSPGGAGVSEAALAGLLHAQAPAYLVGATVVLWRLLTFWLEMSASAFIFSRAIGSRKKLAPREVSE